MMYHGVQPTCHDIEIKNHVAEVMYHVKTIITIKKGPKFQ